MNQIDEVIYRKFVRRLDVEDRKFLIKEYQEIADKLKPLTVGRPKK